MDSGPLDHLAERRESWLDSVAHEPSPGMKALAEIPPEVLADTPARVRTRLNAQPDLIG